jgi:hypothetical protein
MEDRLPHIEKRLYTLEANDTVEPSRLVVQFVGRCVQCVKQGKASNSGRNDTQVMIRDQLFYELECEKKKRLCQQVKRQKSADETFQFLFLIFNVFELR